MSVSSPRRPVPVGSPVARTAPPQRPRPVRTTRTTLALALSTVVLLFGGDLLAQSVQPPGTYAPVGQTLSTLAGLGATDRWVMSTALLLMGLAHLGVARGLHGVPPPARAMVAVGGTCVLVVALAPQPAAGSSPVHMTAMVLGSSAFALWPLVAALLPGLDRRLRVQSVLATAAILAALVWLCAQAWTDGSWLGVAERVLLGAELVWPVRVAVAGLPRRPSRGPAPRAPLERAAPALALLAPVVLVGGFVAAAAAQPVYDPVTQSISTLAGRGAADRWIMVGALLVLGVLYVLVAAGLRPLPRSARVLLGLAGVLVVVAALAAQPADGSNPVHMVAAGLAWFAFLGWPLAVAASGDVDARWRRASAAASGVLALLLAWFAVQLWGSGALYGASQRVVLVAQTVWPIVMALAVARGARTGAGPVRA